MPAHGAAAGTIGHALKSNGVAVTACDWSANRLVDAAAKAAASQGRFSARARDVLSQAMAAAEFGAAMAGVTTHAANNHKCEVVTAAGLTTMVSRRDSAAARGPRESIRSQPARQSAATTNADAEYNKAV